MIIAQIDDEESVLENCDRLLRRFCDGLKAARRVRRPRSTAKTPLRSGVDQHKGSAPLPYWVAQAALRQVEDQLTLRTYKSSADFWADIKKRKKLPSLILLDLKLDGIDENSGLQVLKKVKESRRLKTIPVVMLTTHVDQTFVDASYKRGANAYVGKGDFGEFDGRFLEVITHWTGTSRLPAM
jgi:CheY-like chemotaxis protein